ncbi:MAG: CFI-box-CTERM domain-containing protein [Candidatus Bathyarchaeia archaeon]
MVNLKPLIIIALALTLIQATPSTQPQLALTLQTSKNMYTPGERVYLEGNLTTIKGEPIDHGTISIHVEDPVGTVIHVKMLYSDLKGRFEDSFVLNKESKPGTYNIHVTGSKQGYIDDTVTVKFNVEMLEEAFTIIITPQAQSYIPGDVLMFNIELKILGQTPLEIRLAAEGLPEHSAVKFNPETLTAPGRSVMTIETSDRTPIGNYTVRVTAIGGGFEKTVEAKISGVQPSRCLIVAATHGTALQPIIQHLRAYRENIIVKTFTGREFINFLHKWYYTFSPEIAEYEAEHGPLRTVVRRLIHPFIAILYLTVKTHEHVRVPGETSTLTVGAIAGILVGAVYVAPTIQLVKLLTDRRFKKVRFDCTNLIVLITFSGLVTATLGAVIHSGELAVSGMVQIILGSTLTGIVAGQILISNMWTVWGWFIEEKLLFQQSRLSRLSRQDLSSENEEERVEPATEIQSSTTSVSGNSARRRQHIFNIRSTPTRPNSLDERSTC